MKTTVPETVLHAVKLAWAMRVKTLALIPGTKKYSTAEFEFFTGALTTFASQGYLPPPAWVVLLMSGKNIVTPEQHLELLNEVATRAEEGTL
jgi:hypothetical protein